MRSMPDQAMHAAPDQATHAALDKATHGDHLLGFCIRLHRRTWHAGYELVEKSPCFHAV
jgi:hypothetical protein